MKRRGSTRRPFRPSPLRRLWRDREGGSAVEFAMIAVPFLGLLMGILDTSLYYFNTEAMEGAVQEAARNLMTGRAQGSNVSTASQFVNTYLCPASGRRILPSYVDCSKLIVDVRAATSFASADLSRNFYQNPSSLQFCPGSPGSIVVVRVGYAMPAVVSVLGMNALGSFQRITAGLVNDVPNDAGWKHMIVSTAVFQTEPYQSSAYSAPAGCS